MKELAVELAERKDEIDELIEAAREHARTEFGAIIHPELTDHAKRMYFHNFTDDKKLVDLAVTYLNLQKKD